MSIETSTTAEDRKAQALQHRAYPTPKPVDSDFGRRLVETNAYVRVVGAMASSPDGTATYSAVVQSLSKDQRPLFGDVISDLLFHKALTINVRGTFVSYTLSPTHPAMVEADDARALRAAYRAAERERIEASTRAYSATALAVVADVTAGSAELASDLADAALTRGSLAEGHEYALAAAREGASALTAARDAAARLTAADRSTDQADVVDAVLATEASLALAQRAADMGAAVVLAARRAFDALSPAPAEALAA